MMDLDFKARYVNFTTGANEEVAVNEWVKEGLERALRNNQKLKRLLPTYLGSQSMIDELEKIASWCLKIRYDHETIHNREELIGNFMDRVVDSGILKDYYTAAWEKKYGQGSFSCVLSDAEKVDLVLRHTGKQGYSSFDKIQDDDGSKDFIITIDKLINTGGNASKEIGRRELRETASTLYNYLTWQCTELQSITIAVLQNLMYLESYKNNFKSGMKHIHDNDKARMFLQYLGQAMLQKDAPAVRIKVNQFLREYVGSSHIVEEGGTFEERVQSDSFKYGYERMLDNLLAWVKSPR